MRDLYNDYYTPENTVPGSVLIEVLSDMYPWDKFCEYLDALSTYYFYDMESLRPVFKTWRKIVETDLQDLYKDDDDYKEGEFPPDALLQAWDEALAEKIRQNPRQDLDVTDIIADVNDLSRPMGLALEMAFVANTGFTKENLPEACGMTDQDAAAAFALCKKELAKKS